MLGFLAGHAERRHVDEHQVVVRAAGNDPGALGGERLGHDPGVLDGPALVLAERLLGGQLERHGLGGDDVHQRTTLGPREDVAVDRGGQRAGRGTALDRRESPGVELGRKVAAAEEQPAARPAQRLVRRRRHQVGVRERAGVDARGDEASDVGHVDEQDRPDRVGDLGHPLELPGPRVGRRAADDELRAHLAGLGGHRVVVDPLGVLADAVGVDLVQPAGEVEGHPVGQVAAVGQVHAQDPVTGLRAR